MNDPVTSALQAPPPRYLLESDSSDEEGQGEYAASSSKRAQRFAPVPAISVEWVDAGAAAGAKEVVLGIGQAGRYLRRKLGLKKGAQINPALRVLSGQTELGLGTVHDGIVILALEDVEGEEAWRTVEKLLEGIKGAKWTVITAYVPAMYIPDPDQGSKSSFDAPIRVLSSSAPKKGTTTWESPNYLTGIAGALLSKATHPSSPLSSASLDTILLPLPLSGLNTAEFISSLSTVSPNLSLIISEKHKSAGKESRWDEADDEPFSAPGMGGGRQVASRQPGLAKEEISSMYM